MSFDKEKEWPQILAVLASCLVRFNYGLLFAWPSPTIPLLLLENGPITLTLEEASYLSILNPATAVLFSIPLAKLVDIIGRKFTMLLIAIPQLISWLLIAQSTSIWDLYASRLIAGIADAGIYAVVPMYIGEVTTPKIRGSWGNATTFMTFFGMFFVNLIGSYFDMKTTAWILSSSPVIFFILVSFLPETPYYYALNGREEEAKSSLRWLRRKFDVSKEYNDIVNGISSNKLNSSFKDLFLISSNRKALLVATLLRFVQKFSGITAFSIYCRLLFQMAGGNSTQSALVYVATMAICCTVSSTILDKLGRKRSVLISGSGCTVMLLMMYIFLYLNSNGADMSGLLWFPLVGMLIYIVFVSLGVGTVPTLMLSELFAPNIKSKSLAFMNIIFNIFVAASSKSFQLLVTAFGISAPFAFFAACCFIGTVLCYLTIPETNGKTLEEIQDDLKKPKPICIIIK